MPPLVDIAKFLFGLQRETEHTGIVSPPYVPAYAIPNSIAIATPDENLIQVTWIGHSTFLIQVAGINILTDPIWSKRASPISLMGPKRIARPGMRFEDLPRIDIVLISHTHYDHLDLPTVRKLGNTPHYIVPTGVAKWCKRQKITNVTELAWWDKEICNALTITAVPARHWSKRGLFGTDGALWGGYIVETPQGQIYFAGDTGYAEYYFKEIGKRFNNIVLSLIPIGAYNPRWFMHRFHVNPPEAIRIHQEVGSQHSIGMHWGTIPLTSEPLAEPPPYLEREAHAAGLSPESFTVMQIGETRTI
jgi:L-ascorbate metabolism protein UlaG (beta-lactamase superfamily)